MNRLSTIALCALFVVGARAADTNALTTTTGKTYACVRVVRVDPDGLSIEYAPEPGAVGLAKVKFAVLPRDVQERYGYDPKTAEAFESANTAAVQAWNEQRTAEEEAGRRKIAAQQRAIMEAQAQAAREAYQIELENRDRELRAREVRAKEEQAAAAKKLATRPPAQNINHYFPY